MNQFETPLSWLMPFHRGKRESSEFFPLHSTGTRLYFCISYNADASIMYEFRMGLTVLLGPCQKKRLEGFSNSALVRSVLPCCIC
jgi:hypothetical protein